jgi:hypothetical protein
MDVDCLPAHECKPSNIVYWSIPFVPYCPSSSLAGMPSLIVLVETLTAVGVGIAGQSSRDGIHCTGVNDLKPFGFIQG